MLIVSGFELAAARGGLKGRGAVLGGRQEGRRGCLSSSGGCLCRAVGGVVVLAGGFLFLYFFSGAVEWCSGCVQEVVCCGLARRVVAGGPVGQASVCCLATHARHIVFR